jgi:hypothetical protein
MAAKYTKWPQNIPNGRKMCQMTIIIYQHFTIALQMMLELLFLANIPSSGNPGHEDATYVLASQRIEEPESSVAHFRLVLPEVGNEGQLEGRLHACKVKIQLL